MERMFREMNVGNVRTLVVSTPNPYKIFVKKIAPNEFHIIEANRRHRLYPKTARLVSNQEWNQYVNGIGTLRQLLHIVNYANTVVSPNTPRR